MSLVVAGLMYREIKSAPILPPPGPITPGSCPIEPGGSWQQLELSSSDSSNVMISNPSLRNAGEETILGTHVCNQRSAETSPPGRPSLHGESCPSLQTFGVMKTKFGVAFSSARSWARLSKFTTLASQLA